jgi:hypothetical protein
MLRCTLRITNGVQNNSKAKTSIHLVAAARLGQFATVFGVILGVETARFSGCDV